MRERERDLRPCHRNLPRLYVVVCFLCYETSDVLVEMTFTLLRVICPGCWLTSYKLWPLFQRHQKINCPYVLSLLLPHVPGLSSPRELRGALLGDGTPSSSRPPVSSIRGLLGRTSQPVLGYFHFPFYWTCKQEVKSYTAIPSWAISEPEAKEKSIILVLSSF